MQFLDFAALEHNALFYKNLLGNSKLCAVVKNNAYGHGLAHVARYLDRIVDCFAVGSVDEAEEIDFVCKDILVLLPQDEARTYIAARKGYILTVDSFSTLNTVKNIADKLDLNIRVHLKFDSGMSRLGFKQNDVSELLYSIKSDPRVIVEGVYSHFYGENVATCDKQYTEFTTCAKRIEKALNKRLLKHVANSCGALLSSNYCSDMARIGLGLYGYGNSNLIPVKTVTAKVIAVKNVDKGDVVGYGAKFVAPYDSRIAVINVGYARGFARSLVGSQIKINGASCKVVAVCMAMIIADVGDAEVVVGDEAVLLGQKVNISNETVSIYELLCNLK